MKNLNLRQPLIKKPILLVFVLGVISFLGNSLNHRLNEIFRVNSFDGVLEKSTQMSQWVMVPLGIIIGCGVALLIEHLFLIGSEKESSLKKLFGSSNDTRRSDWFYFLLRVSGLYEVFSMIFTFGAAHIFYSWVSQNFSIQMLRDLNFFTSFLAVAIVNSFVFYWVHRAMHSRLFWNLHKIHHSAKELNMITCLRNHPIDHAVVLIFNAFPAALLGASPNVILMYMGFNALYQLFVHSELDWNLGFLNKIFITSQEHRIHHSNDPNHWGRNYGMISLWDHFFGTYHPPLCQGLNYGVDGQKEFEGNPISIMMKTYWDFLLSRGKSEVTPKIKSRV